MLTATEAHQGVAGIQEAPGNLQARSADSQNLVAFRRCYAVFLAKLIDAFDKEICKDEPQSVSAWYPVFLDVLLSIEQLHYSLARRDWRSNHGGDWLYGARKKEVAQERIDQTELLSSTLLMTRLSPERRHQICSSVLYELFDSLWQTVGSESVDLDALKAFEIDHHDLNIERQIRRVSSTCRADLRRAVEQCPVEFESPKQLANIIRKEIRNPDGVSPDVSRWLRECCIPSRGISLVGAYRLAFHKLRLGSDSATDILPDFEEVLEEHNEKLSWVSHILLDDQESESSEAKIVKSMNRRHSEFAKSLERA